MSGMVIRDVGRIGIANLGGAETLEPGQREVLDEYLRQFAETADEDGIRCPGCGTLLHGPLFMGQALGVYSFEWGLVHGSGFCRGAMFADEGCGWPVTVYHRVTVPGREDPVRFDAPLPVHPDALL